MQMPMQLTFEGCEPSEAVRAAIEREIERLEKRNRRRASCRGDSAQSDANHGTGHRVHIWLTIPPHEQIVVN